MGLEENWKTIAGYEGYYEVSDLGNVRSLDRGNRKGKLLVSNTGKYKGVFLCKLGTIKRKNIHRLVAETFIPNPENKPLVNHKDGDKHNNKLENLEWCTHQENMNHAYENNLIPPYTDELREIRRQAKLGKKLSEGTRSKIVTALGKSIKCIEDNIIFNSIKEASEFYRIPKTSFHRKFKNGEKILGKQFIEWYNCKQHESTNINNQ